MPTLGQKLKAGRDRRGATTSQAAAATRIKFQHIEAMEADQFQRIPAPTYAKGFIRMYAEYLGLDPAPLVREYAEQYMPKTKTKLTPPEPAPAAPTAAAPRKAAPAHLIQRVEEPASAPPPARPAKARPAPVDFGKAWATFSAALRQAWAGFRPALARVPWKLAGAVAVLVVATVAIGRVIGNRSSAPAGPVVVNAADAVRIPGDMPAVIREPPEPYLEARPPGRRAP